MIDALKPTREIIDELRQLETTSIIVIGVGKIQNITYDEFDNWRCSIKLNDNISIKCQKQVIRKYDNRHFEKGDIIKFIGRVNTNWKGINCRYNVSDIYILNAKVCCEERFYTEVVMWNIETYNHIWEGEKVAITRDKYGVINSQIVCISELEETESTENKWTFGHLIKKGKYVILQLDKVIE